jgi:maleate isomerase
LCANFYDRTDRHLRDPINIGRRMFGWRKRIGYIGPTVMEVVPYEFYRFAPDGVGLVGVTCSIDDWSSEQFDRGLAQVKGAAAYLGSRAVDFIIHGGGPLVVAHGKGYEENIVKDIEAASKVAATTGVRAAMEALRHIGARRIAIASPYPERHNQALSDYLGQHGFELARVEGMDVPFKQLQCVPPVEIYRFAAEVISRASRCDALYLPCPQWQAAQIVDALEQESGMPAIAYSHATFFVAFKALGLGDPIRGHGRLLASLAR